MVRFLVRRIFPRLCLTRFSGHLVFDSPEAAAQAVLLDGSQFGGRPMKVQYPRDFDEEFAWKRVHVSGIPHQNSLQFIHNFFAECGMKE